MRLLVPFISLVLSVTSALASEMPKVTLNLASGANQIVVQSIATPRLLSSDRIKIYEESGIIDIIHQYFGRFEISLNLFTWNPGTENWDATGVEIGQFRNLKYCGVLIAASRSLRELGPLINTSYSAGGYGIIKGTGKFNGVNLEYRALRMVESGGNNPLGDLVYFCSTNKTTYDSAALNKVISVATNNILSLSN